MADKGGSGCLVQLAALVIVLVFGVPLLMTGVVCAGAAAVVGGSAAQDAQDEKDARRGRIEYRNHHAAIRAAAEAAAATQPTTQPVSP